MRGRFGRVRKRSSEILVCEGLLASTTWGMRRAWDENVGPSTNEDHTGTLPIANSDARPVVPSSIPSAPPKKPTVPTSDALQELAAKQERPQRMIAEQKTLSFELVQLLQRRRLRKLGRT